MTMPFTHKKDEVRATGTLEARTPGDQAVQVLLYVIIALVALACVLPFIYVVAGSFATERELTERPFFLIPQDVSLNAYQYILKQGDVFRGLKNSVIVTVIGTLINMFVSCTIAYPLSRPYLKGRNGFINMVIVTMLFTGGMVPAYIMVVNVLHLGNTYWALWLPTAMSAFNMIIIKNYFQGIPMELEEAAIIDGSNASSCRCPRRCWPRSACSTRSATGTATSKRCCTSTTPTWRSSPSCCGVWCS